MRVTVDGSTHEVRISTVQYFGKACLSNLKYAIKLIGLVCILFSVPVKAQQITLPSSEWAQMVVPADASTVSLQTLFGNFLSPIDYTSTWVAYRFNASERSYEPITLDDTIPIGTGFWIAQVTGSPVEISLPAGLVPPVSALSTGCTAAEGCFSKVLIKQDSLAQATVYNMIGSPFDRETPVSELAFVGEGAICDDGCSLTEAGAEGVTDNAIYVYDPAIADYLQAGSTDADALAPWQGFWIGMRGDGALDNPRILFPAIPQVGNPCDGVQGETPECPFPAVSLETSPFEVTAAVGQPVNISTTVSFTTVRSDTYTVVVEQTVQSDDGDAQNFNINPAVAGGFQTQADLTTVDNQVLTASAAGTYTVTTTATIEETNETVSSVVTFVASDEEGHVFVGPPGVSPPVVIPNADTTLVFSAMASSTAAAGVLTVGIVGDLSVTLLDDGNGADLAAGDGAFSGTAVVSAGTLSAGECLSVSATASLGGSAATSSAVDICGSTLPSLPAPPNLSLTISDIEASELLSTELLVAVTSDATDSQVTAAASAVDGEIVGGIPQLHTYQIRLSSALLSAAELQSVIDTLEVFDYVVYAEPVSVSSTQEVTPNDSRYGEQFMLSRIRADEAWTIARGKVTIAVVDTGVDLDHPDLQSKVLPGRDFINDDTNADDDHGHGTHVAGIAAAVSNNSVGVTGVAWGSNVLPVKACDDEGHCPATSIAAAIVWAADRGARVINVSLRVKNSFFGLITTTETTICAAVTYANSMGSLVVAAAGNDSSSTEVFPAACAGAFSVGNVTAADQRAASSNFGSWVDIAAPGVDILSTVPVGGTCALCNASGYEELTGTSMASPAIAGAAAVILSRESLTNQQIMDRISRTSVELPAGAQVGAGRLDLFEAVFNGSFEEGNLALWDVQGTASSKSALAQIMPQHRKRMGSVSTGPADAQVSGSLEQQFMIQPGVTSFPLSFRYAFVTEEYPEFVGSSFDDSLRVVLITPQGTERLLAEESVNESSFISISGIDFPGGDTTTGWTGWQTVSVNITVTEGAGLYRIFLTDAGDSVYDTETLVDDIKFRSSAPQQ